MDLGVGDRRPLHEELRWHGVESSPAVRYLRELLSPGSTPRLLESVALQVNKLHAGQSSRENPIFRTITVSNYGSKVAKYSISHSPSLAVNFSYVVAEQNEVGVDGQHLEPPPLPLLASERIPETNRIHLVLVGMQKGALSLFGSH
jgi:hypothetical protein